ncbi:MAG: peptidylprolyl isomerase [Ferruginibacter sp.]|nr:peptidylprolyl isomerase [Ferruginibacter sp.]
MIKNVLLIYIISIVSCTAKSNSNPQILISTNYGDIEAELFPQKAPKTVTAFLSYINSGYYKNTTFYRVLKIDDLPEDINYGIIQGGLWPNLKNIKGITHEPTSLTGLTHSNGTLSLARTGIGTASTEFFICIGNQSNFNAGGNSGVDTLGFAAFGTVLHGMRVVRKIQAQAYNNDHFKVPIKINNITIL